MPKLIVFNHISLDGYFVDANNQMSWAKNHVDDEWNSFVTENAKGGWRFTVWPRHLPDDGQLLAHGSRLAKHA